MVLCYSDCDNMDSDNWFSFERNFMEIVLVSRLYFKDRVEIQDPFIIQKIGKYFILQVQ